MKATWTYLLVYNGHAGTGNSVIARKARITSHDDIRRIEDALADQHGFPIVLTNIVLLDSPRGEVTP